MTSHFGMPQVIFHLGRQQIKSGPPHWGRKMAFYAPLVHFGLSDPHPLVWVTHPPVERRLIT